MCFKAKPQCQSWLWKFPQSLSLRCSNLQKHLVAILQWVFSIIIIITSPERHSMHLKTTLETVGNMIFRGQLDVPLPTYPYWKSLYKPYIVGIYICVIICYNPQESLENTINTMGTLLGVHPSVPSDMCVTFEGFAWQYNETLHRVHNEIGTQGPQAFWTCGCKYE